MTSDQLVVTSRELTQITDQIYIGTYHAAQMLDFTNRVGITHILNCTPDAHAGLKKFNVRQLNIMDGYETPAESIRFALMTIASAIHNHGRILVHCHAGISRSVSIVCAHFMYAGFSWDEAMDFVRSRRPQAFPHPNIERSIKHFFGKNINARTTMLGEL
jgi:protein-tyrosine phosphatase